LGIAGFEVVFAGIISGMLGSWPGRKGLVLKKHRPIGFRLLGFCFSIRIPQSAFRNSNGPLLKGIEGAS
jgi:hypothetical protein